MERPYFHFKRLVRKYSRDIVLLVQEPGSYKSGIYQSGETTPCKCKGAILSKNRSAFRNDGGNYAAEDKILYMLQPSPHVLERVQVQFRGQMYKPVVDRDHSDAALTGVYVYRLAWVEPFCREEEHDD